MIAVGNILCQMGHSLCLAVLINIEKMHHGDINQGKWWKICRKIHYVMQEQWPFFMNQMILMRQVCFYIFFAEMDYNNEIDHR